MKPNVPKEKQFGRIFGDPDEPSYITDQGIAVWMWRKGQRVRFLTADGTQIGPEQRNVFPAICAADAAGWLHWTLLRHLIKQDLSSPRL